MSKKIIAVDDETGPIYKKGPVIHVKLTPDAEDSYNDGLNQAGERIIQYSYPDYCYYAGHLRDK